MKKRMELLKQLPHKGLAYIHSGMTQKASNDTDYPFEVDRNFYYFTGISEPNLVLVLFRYESSYKEALFIPRVDISQEKWTGKMLTVKEATYLSGIINVRYLDELDSFLASLVSGFQVDRFFTYIQALPDSEPGNAYTVAYRKLKRQFPGCEFSNLFFLTMPMRAVKSYEEQEVMKIASRITKQAFEECFKHIKPGIMEYEVQAAFEYVVKRHGGKTAFESIVASGSNATTLHYVNNNSQLNDGDLVLMDCGASYGWYNADVTRTVPVNGSFTERQLEIYNIVLGANLHIIKNVKPGISCNQLNALLIAYYQKELKAAGLISEDSEVSEYYYHGVSHSLGLDTHDVFSKDLPLAPGMVITVEPGLYFAKYNIGVRIEDDVLLTPAGNEVLTADIVKNPSEIEEFMNVWEVK